LNEGQSQKLVVLDIDGTISSAGGPIEAEDIKALEGKAITWGILSARSQERAKEACDAMGITPHFIETCRVDMRAEELNDLAKRYQSDQYIYVADREVDHKETKRAGWRFIFAPNFRGTII